jgi:uncharacterized protein YndB with AHSA1/START domain
MNDAPTTRAVLVERTMPHPPEKVWRALTQPALVSEWLMQTDLEPVVGRRFNFRAEPQGGWNGVTDCEVLEVEEPKRLVYSWSASGEQAATGVKSVVTWTLTPTNGGTHVRMEHAGFRVGPDDGFYQGATYGWQKMVAGLERVAGEIA